MMKITCTMIVLFVIHKLDGCNYQPDDLLPCSQGQELYFGLLRDREEACTVVCTPEVMGISTITTGPKYKNQWIDSNLVRREHDGAYIHIFLRIKFIVLLQLIGRVSHPYLPEKEKEKEREGMSSVQQHPGTGRWARRWKFLRYSMSHGKKPTVIFIPGRRKNGQSEQRPTIKFKYHQD